MLLPPDRGNPRILKASTGEISYFCILHSTLKQSPDLSPSFFSISRSSKWAESVNPGSSEKRWIRSPIVSHGVVAVAVLLASLHSRSLVLRAVPFFYSSRFLNIARAVNVAEFLCPLRSPSFHATTSLHCFFFSFVLESRTFTLSIFGIESVLLPVASLRIILPVRLSRVFLLSFSSRLGRSTGALPAVLTFQ